MLRRAWQAIGGALIILVIYLSVAPLPLEIPGPQGDKMGHALAYGVLMAWFAQIERARGGRIVYAMAFAAMAIALEFVQGVLPNRMFDVNDMVAGAIGIGIGWISAPPRGPDVYRGIARLLGGG